MTPEQTERLFSTLGRIEQKIESHLDEDTIVHARHERAISEQSAKLAAVEKTQARHRGIALGAVGVFSTILALFKYNGG